MRRAVLRHMAYTAAGAVIAGGLWLILAVGVIAVMAADTCT